MKRLAILAVVAALLCATPAPLAAQTASSAQARSAVSATQFDKFVQGRQYPELAQQLKSAQLDEVTRDYFNGVLANRENRLQDAVALLEKVIPELKRTSGPRAAIALRAMGDSYTKLFRYADATRTYAEALNSFGDQFSKSERKSLDDDHRTLQLMIDAPPQQIEVDRAFTIPTVRGPLGTIDTEIEVNGVKVPWIVDTGANFSVVSSSLAHRLGLKLSSKTASTQGITGAENPLRIAVLPEVAIGPAKLRNVILLVLEDASLQIPIGKDKTYQIEAILGYPVLNAFDSLTFSYDGKLTFGKQRQDSGGAPLYMELLMPLLQARVNDRDLLFSFDTGADRSIFTSKYLDQFRGKFFGAKDGLYGLGGAGGTRRVTVYYEPEVELQLGDRTVSMKEVPVMTKPLGTDTDNLNGNLGRDLVEALQSFTIDFHHMRFLLGEPKPVAEKSQAAAAQ